MNFPLLAFVFVGAGLAAATPAVGCDELVGKLIAGAVGPSIQALGCSELGKAGLGKADHRLERVCYEYLGAESRVSMTVALTCMTSDSAFIKASISDTMTASARVSASDCQILDLRVDAAGDIGRILLAAFDAEGAARKALQKALDGMCG